MDRQGQILRGPSSIICDETDVAAVWWKPCEYACYWLFMFLKRNMDSEFFGLTWSCWNETLAALTLHLQAILIEYGRWFIIVTGSLKTPRGLCNIFFCLNLKKKIKPRKPNQANSRESITNPDIFHRPGGSGCTYLDDSVLEAPKSFKNDRVLRGVDENDEHKTHAKKTKWWQM